MKGKADEFACEAVKSLGESVECCVSCCPLSIQRPPGINSNHPQPTSNIGQKVFSDAETFQGAVVKEEGQRFAGVTLYRVVCRV